jgi:hypothetical protein
MPMCRHHSGYHAHGLANVFKITKYAYTNDQRVRIDWLNSGDKESVTVFAEFIGGSGPRRAVDRTS